MTKRYVALVSGATVKVWRASDDEDALYLISTLIGYASPANVVIGNSLNELDARLSEIPAACGVHYDVENYDGGLIYVWD